MKTCYLLPTALMFLLGTSYAEAQTSLYIPGFEPQAVSADILGVGPDGRTTWALHQGEITHASDQSGFIGTATLVEGSRDASLTYANSAAHFTIGQACSFSEGFAICTVVVGGSTAVQTEFTSHVPVQVGSTMVGSATSTSRSHSDFSVPPTLPPSSPGATMSISPSSDLPQTQITELPPSTSTSSASFGVNLSCRLGVAVGLVALTMLLS